MRSATLGLLLWACCACATLPELGPSTGEPKTILSPRARTTVHQLKLVGPAERLPIVLLHPWAADLRIWGLVAPILQKERTVLLIDLPGHGASGHPPGRYPPRRLAQAVLDAMHQAGIQRAIVVGNSLGGATTLALEELAPEATAGLVLIGAPGGVAVPAPLKSLARRATAARVLSSVSPSSLSWAVHLAASSFAPGVAMLAKDIVEARTSVWPAAAPALSSALWEVMDWAPDLERIHKPVLVVAGEDDTIVPLASQRAIATRIEGAALVTLERCGHFPEVDCPAAFLQALEPFLSRVDGPK